MGTIDFSRIRASVALSDIVGQSVELKRRGAEFLGLCPFHDERTPSFSVNDAKGRFHCFGCGASGDVLDFVSHVQGIGLGEAAAFLDNGDTPRRIERPAFDQAKDDEVKRARGREVWSTAGLIEGSPAETYLRRRGITCELPETLAAGWRQHFTRPASSAFPTLLAAVTDATGNVQGTQSIFLTEDGKKASVSPQKESTGLIRGGAVRFGQPGASLIICEGIEDGLTLFQECGEAVAATCGTSCLGTVSLPDSVQRVILALDNDWAGKAAGKKAADALVQRGLKVRAIRPSPGFKDFNDELRGIPE
jgi:DNA primase|tara:strand:- start:24010 stop:24927 length:918 start_codon:yes stop_codon:yes gene_type:complete